MTLYASGLQPTTFYTVQIWTDKGKLKQKLGENSSKEGDFAIYGFDIAEWPNGVYTLQLYLNDALLAQTTMTIKHEK